MLARVEDCVLIVVDIQPSVLDGCWEKERVVKRAAFMMDCANLLDVPMIVTEQNPKKLGECVASLRAKTTDPKGIISKTTFSCWGERQFRMSIEGHKRSQAVIVGIESHICVCQTAHDLMDEDIDVLVCADGVSARTQTMHDNGLKRMADEGAALAHTESVVYEWLQDSEHPRFRDVLKLVKG